MTLIIHLGFINLEFAQRHNIPYIMDIEKAFQDHIADFVVICSEAERHCDLAVRAANFGLSIISDKPMSNRLSECERLFHSVKINKVKYMLWNRNFLPALLKAKQILSDRNLGPINSFHVDFFFSKDSGPPKSISNQSGKKLIGFLVKLKLMLMVLMGVLVTNLWVN